MANFWWHKVQSIETSRVANSELSSSKWCGERVRGGNWRGEYVRVKLIEQFWASTDDSHLTLSNASLTIPEKTSKHFKKKVIKLQLRLWEVIFARKSLQIDKNLIKHGECRSHPSTGPQAINFHLPLTQKLPNISGGVRKSKCFDVKLL